ncbi:SART-1 family protein [Besnoitia besnoiti]|uniref:SART-1 family protein n=1 Tax=Besnoitia besnoiti TaxID=94643 RepID=A0A2A9MLH9_BESBE|nr:SART-1 family protein [Besnoitia besnoiti]PFH36320.1 SART-1 family protein [Besnoitia besnoiti]
MSSAKEISLSVEETNKLRIKLGLQPLKIDETHQADEGSAADVDKQAAAPSEYQALTEAEREAQRRQAAQNLRDRTEERKRKAIHAAMTGGPALGEQDDDLDDPAAWVARMRKQEKEKQVLASQARADAAHYDDDSDEETSVPSGGGALRAQGEDSIPPAKRHKGTPSEDAEAGVKVLHDLKDFEEGETVVLTLKDTQILTSDGRLNEEVDALENISLVEKRKLQKKLRDKEKKTLYDPTEDWEAGEDGAPQKKEILAHYDEWERENLAAQGKGSLPEDDKGFILPSVHGSDADAPVEVQIELLRERQKLVEREKRKLLGLSAFASYHRDDVELTGAHLNRQKYDASGASSVVLTGEREAATGAEEFAFRKLKKKKKIQKKKQGAEFWKELLGSKPQDEEEGEAQDQDEDDEIRPVPVKTKKTDRHHGSRAEKRDRDSKRSDTQKQHVREALAAAASAGKNLSPAPSSYRRAREETNHDAKNAELDVEGSDDLVDVGAVDRELQESLEKQRRLALTKLCEQREDSEKDGTEEDRKKPQARLLNLLRRQAGHKGNVVDDELLPMDVSKTEPMASRFSKAGGAGDQPDGDEEEDTRGLQLTTTTEFCRALQTPLEKMENLKQEAYVGSRFSRQHKSAQVKEERASKASDRARRDEEEDDEDEKGAQRDDSGSKERDGASSSEEEDEDELDTGFMNENPMGQGLAEALKYLQSKNHYSLDKMRQRRHRPDELPLHKPLGEKDIKIDRRDQFGNVMTPKDAFRQISWRFHGKYPSLRKQEKKMKKMDIERKLLQNPMEALPTLNALQKLQETEKVSHLVLTGGSLDQ